MTTTEAILERATRRLRELRESLGLQQNQFAAMFGVSGAFLFAQKQKYLPKTLDTVTPM